MAGTMMQSIPSIVDPMRIRVVMISEALPHNLEDYFYCGSSSLFVTNTIDAFNSAGMQVRSIEEIVGKGVYLTVAVKEPRVGPSISTDVVKRNSYQLEEELGHFPNVRAILLMGDVAIKAMNYISLRAKKGRAIPHGSTYKIRKGKFYYGSIRVFPSYLQTGKSFLIERSKRKMVAEDIRDAFSLLES